jgi:mRNA interferase RelE/StbE
MYEIEILRPALKELARLPANYPRLVVERIDALADDPRPSGAIKLRGEPGYRLRVGIYRILYEIDDQTQRVTVYRIKHRREAYRK